MSVSFPLYDNIIKGIKNKDLTAKQKSDLTKRINDINDNGATLVYALIKTYSINEGSKFSLLPYNGERRDQSGITFDLEKFPNKLKQVLYKFIDLHDKSIISCTNT